MFCSETSEFLLGKDQLLLFPLFSPNLKRVIVVIHLCSEPVRTCPRPAQGKARQKAGTGLPSREFSFFSVASVCSFQWHLFALFSREICVLRNDVSIPKHRYPWHLLVVTQVRIGGCGKCSRSWCSCSLSYGGGILHQAAPRGVLAIGKRLSESAENGGASCLILVLVTVGLECLG